MTGQKTQEQKRKEWIEDLERRLYTFTDPWDRIIAKGKYYHGIRVRGNKKSTNTYQLFSGKVAECWNAVTEKCRSAEILEQEVRRILM